MERIITAKDYVKTVKRGWWIAVILAVVAGTVFFLTSYKAATKQAPRGFGSAVNVYFKYAPGQPIEQGDLNRDYGTLIARISTYELREELRTHFLTFSDTLKNFELVSGDREKVINEWFNKNVGNGFDGGSFTFYIGELEVEDWSKGVAFADKFIEIIIRKISELKPEYDSSFRTIEYTVTARPTPTALIEDSRAGSTMKLLLSVATGIIVGAAAYLVLVFIFYFINPKFNNGAEITENLKLPILGEVKTEAYETVVIEKIAYLLKKENKKSVNFIAFADKHTDITPFADKLAAAGFTVKVSGASDYFAASQNADAAVIGLQTNAVKAETLAAVIEDLKVLEKTVSGAVIF